MAKSTKTTVRQRVNEIALLLLKGESRQGILQYATGAWGVTERQADTYIAKARKEIEESVSKGIEYNYAKAVRRYEELYKLSFEQKDYRTAATINKELASLQGLLKQQFEHSGQVTFVSSIPE